MRIPLGTASPYNEPAPQQVTQLRGPTNYTANAITGALNTVSNIADKVQQEDDQKAEEARATAEKVKTITAHAKIENGLADLRDSYDKGLQDGKINPADAQKTFSEHAQFIVQENLKELPEGLKQLIGAESIGITGKYTRDLTNTVTKKTQDNNAAGLNTYIESMQRLAPTDREKAIKLGISAINNLGAGANLSAKDIADKKQKFIEDVDYTAAYSKVALAPDDIDELQKIKTSITSDDYKNIDPYKRATLLSHLTDKIDTLKRSQQADVLNVKKQQEKTYQDFKEFIGKNPPSTEYIAKTIESLQGSGFESKIASELRDAADRRNFGGLPVQQQDKVIADTIATGVDEDGAKILKRRQEITDSVKANIESRGISAAVDYGIIDKLSPIGADPAELPAQIAARIEQAKKASTWANKTLAPLENEEIKTFGDTLESLPYKLQSRLLGETTKAMGYEAMVTMAGKLKDTHGKMAIAGYLSAKGLQGNRGSVISEMFLKGEDAIKTKTVDTTEIERPSIGLRAQLNTLLTDVYLDQRARLMDVEAAIGVYAGYKAAGNPVSEAEALTLVNGGTMDYGGGKIIRPYGMTKGQTEDALDTISQEAEFTKRYGNTFKLGVRTLTSKEVASSLSNATLRTVNDGRYVVFDGLSPVMLESGEPLVIDINEFNK